MTSGYTLSIGATIFAWTPAAPGAANAEGTDEWPICGHGYDNTRYCPPEQIKSENVSNLKLASLHAANSLGPDTGDELRKTQPGSGIGAAPIIYSTDGKQYVAVVPGRTVAIAAFPGDIGNQMTDATPEGGTLFVFLE
jgi:glucose dehydrogenase